MKFRNNELGFNKIVELLPDAAAHSEYEDLIRCDFGATPVECAELECLM
jgi:hypothetical protein